MGKINAEWHRVHRMPKNPTERQRAKWHCEHASHCGCREISPSIAALLEPHGFEVPAAQAPWQAPRQAPALNCASVDATFDAQENAMRTTVTLDDELLEKARRYTGIKEKSALINEALTVLVAREAGRRLAALGGTEPDLVAPPRRRFPAK